MVATEADPVSVACARANGVVVHEGDLDAPLPPGLAGTVDVLCGVLPYVPTGSLHLLPRDVVAHEPRAALDGGADGLAALTRVIATSGRWVAQGGWLVLEAGGTQFPEVEAMFGRAGYRSVRVLYDGDGDPRGMCGQLAGPVGRPTDRAV